MIKKEDTYKIGQIGKPHGLKGEVIFNFTDDIFDRVDCPYLICEVEGILVPFFLEEYRFKTDSSALLKFDGIDSVEDTRQIVGSDVFFENKFIEESDEEEVSLSYFVGFNAIDSEGNAIGEIVDIDDNTENWLFVVEDSEGKEILIPAHEEFIIDINHKKKTIEMDLPEGLLEL
ncbi:MAG: ribosome maturation factor RimM [Bacteroidaceae bacterium]|nr:ribosome maturation factor RimM [Bacteroidaceae bacterium]